MKSNRKIQKLKYRSRGTEEKLMVLEKVTDCNNREYIIQK